jgi:hypothetical protein
MSNDVNAVIEALKVALEEAEKDREESDYRDVQHVNRWIRQLPGAWRGARI